MNDGTELHGRLDRLARLAGDDGTAERMLARVSPMVTRVRRRRAARRTGMSLAAVGAVAAVGLTASLLGRLPGGTTGPLVPAGPPSQLCGQAPPSVSNAPLGLGYGVSGAVTRADVELNLHNPHDASVALVVPVVSDVYLVQDGTVAATGSGSDPGVATLVHEHSTQTIAPSDRLDAWTRVGLTSCRADGTISDGDYAVVVVVRDADGAVQAIGTGVELGVTAGRFGMSTQAKVEAAQAKAQAELAALTSVLDGDHSTAFPACGSRLPAATADAPVSLRLTLDSPTVGQLTALMPSATLTATNGRHVVATTPVVGTDAGTVPMATLVLVRNGVVVATPHLGHPDVGQVDLTGQGSTVMALGQASVCDPTGRSTAGLIALPRGDYHVYAVLRLTGLGVTAADGTTTSPADQLVVSQPVTATAP
jgi:hypothetical protein